VVSVVFAVYVVVALLKNQTLLAIIAYSREFRNDEAACQSLQTLFKKGSKFNQKSVFYLIFSILKSNFAQKKYPYGKLNYLFRK